MGLLDKFRNRSPTAGARYQMVTEIGNGFYVWDGKIYQSDIVRACIRPKMKAVGKLVAKHIRIDNKNVTKVNPEPYMRFLLEEPNPFMSGQKMQEKLASQLCLNNNAFALIIRNEDKIPIEIYPILPTSYEAIYNNNGDLFLRFIMPNGKTFTYSYRDIIHIREDYAENEVFGAPKSQALTPLMEIVATIDQGIVKAIKNGATIRWLLKFMTAMRVEDLKKQTEEFAKNYLETTNNGTGVAGIDSKAEAQQITPHDYVPNSAQMSGTVKRIYSFFNTNEKIIASSYNEDEWNAYYEAEIEPVAIDLKNEFTRKLFTRKERGFGNYITFDASNLSTASMSTKLSLVQFVDRGMMTPNEVRSILNLAPIEGGDKAIRRLDTAVIGGESDEEDRD